MRIVLLLLAPGCTASPADSAAPPDNGSVDVWGTMADGRSVELPFLPDQNARYWRYAFAPPTPDEVIRIRGTLAGARYQALDVYDDLDRTSIGATRDSQLGDPFTVYLTQRTDVDGLVVDPPTDVEVVSLFMRLYVPDNPDLMGPLPQVDLWNPDDASSSPPPTPIPTPEIPQALIDLFLAQLEIPQRDDRVDFYNVASDGLYAADDNRYLTAQITRAPGEVVLVRFKAPTAGLDDQVRYWSLSQGDRHSYTFHTHADHEASVAPDGWVTLVIADDTPQLRDAAAGHDFLVWSTPDDEMVLIYRNLVSRDDFVGNQSAVPLFDFDQPAEGQEAPLFLGDYAPVGIRCAADQFISDGCGGWLDQR